MSSATPFLMPDVVGPRGRHYFDALAQLEDAGLPPERVHLVPGADASMGPGMVRAQSPRPGTALDARSDIWLDVAVTPPQRHTAVVAAGDDAVARAGDAFWIALTSVALRELYRQRRHVRRLAVLEPDPAVTQRLLAMLGLSALAEGMTPTKQALFLALAARLNHFAGRVRGMHVFLSRVLETRIAVTPHRAVRGAIAFRDRSHLGDARLARAGGSFVLGAHHTSAFLDLDIRWIDLDRDGADRLAAEGWLDARRALRPTDRLRALVDLVAPAYARVRILAPALPWRLETKSRAHLGALRLARGGETRP